MSDICAAQSEGESKPEMTPTEKYMARRRKREAVLAKRAEAEAARIVKVPAYWADNDVRRKRLRFIREKIGMSRREFAAEIGLSQHFYTKVEYGLKNCSLVYVKSAERVLKSVDNRADYRNRMVKQRVDKIKKSAEQIAEIRAKAVALYVQGVDATVIANQLNQAPATIVRWVQSLQ